MKLHAWSHTAAAIACLGMVLPPSAFAVTPTTIETNDVALRAGGLLVGQVIDPQGVAKPGTSVSVQFSGTEVVRTTTDANGIFAAQGLRGGQYQLVTPDGIRVCRLWAPDTAPPSAHPAALVVSGGDVVRGQGQGPPCGNECAPAQRGGPMNSWVGWIKAHPYITAGTVAAAIAIPLALADDDNDSGS